MLKSLISAPIISKLFNFAKEEFVEVCDDKSLELINKNIQTELLSESLFVKFWRPFFGYCVAVAWIMYMTIICYIVLSDKPNAIDLIYAMAETTSLWSMALGVLGISVIKRSSDKKLLNLFNKKKKGEK